jgi:hypothetical protein
MVTAWLMTTFELTLATDPDATDADMKATRVPETATDDSDWIVTALDTTVPPAMLTELLASNDAAASVTP